MVKRKKSSATVLIMLAEEAGLKLFHTEDRQPFALVPIRETRQVWPLRSREMAIWLRLLYYNARNRSPSSNAILDTLAHLEGMALFHAPVAKTWMRAADDGTTLYIDLADPQWRAIRIFDGEWSVEDRPTVYFRRPAGMMPLPLPERGGSYDLLRRYINLGSDGDWLLYLAFVTAAMRPYGPFPVLSIIGQQGSAKSTLAEFTRWIVDPSAAMWSAEPKEMRELAIQAENSWLLVFDNLSYLEKWFSDALCRLATGGGFRTRKLYAGREEELFSLMRPIVLTSIADVVTRGDLLNRTLLLYVPAVAETEYKTLEAIRSAFVQDMPLILGGLYSLVAKAQRRFRYVAATGLPRMAEFARWGIAVERVLELPKGAFLDAFRANMQMGKQLAMEADTITLAILELARTDGNFRGTATVLLARLQTVWPENMRGRDWPRMPHHLSGQLRRVAPVLLNRGLKVAFSFAHAERIVTIEKIGDGNSASAALAALALTEEYIDANIFDK